MGKQILLKNGCFYFSSPYFIFFGSLYSSQSIKGNGKTSGKQNLVDIEPPSTPMIEELPTNFHKMPGGATGPGVDERGTSRDNNVLESIAHIKKSMKMHTLLTMIQSNQIGEIDKLERIKNAEFLPAFSSSDPQPISICGGKLLDEWEFDMM